MIIHCPSCNTEYDCAPGKYECECGAKFSVTTDGSLFMEDTASLESLSSEQTVNLDIDKTIPPRQHQEETLDIDATMPGKRERKPDGRFEVGDLILGRYKVLSELGQGGMGVVYKCFDEVAGITIALKALPPELSHNTMEMEDVKENFQLIHNLHHPNIASSNTLEKDSTTGNYYLVMECVEGEDLRRWIRQKHKEGPLTVDTILPVIRQVAAALDYAHEQKIIHRDIKPGNIMIDAEGHVKVLDFGLAAQIHTSMTRVSMAYHGTSGTAPYMAPEQWRGKAQGAAADQYALAVMTYEMLAGHLPFESTDASVLREAVLNETVEPLQGIPVYAQQALARGMSKESEARFASCSDFAMALNGNIAITENAKGCNTTFIAQEIKNEEKATKLSSQLDNQDLSVSPKQKRRFSKKRIVFLVVTAVLLIKMLLYLVQPGVALYWAVTFNQALLVKILCKTGAKVDVVISGQTPLILAANRGAAASAEALIQYGKGIDLEARYQAPLGDGGTALCCAVSENHPKTVEVLCKAGANVNAYEGFSGRTPLTEAVYRSRIDIIKILLRYGADPYYRDHSHNKYNAIEMAQHERREDIVDLLKNFPCSVQK